METALRNNGFLPNLIGVLVNAPAALVMYQEMDALNATISLTAGEREMVQITAVVLNECSFCKVEHTPLNTKKNFLHPQAIEALRNTQALEDSKLSRSVKLLTASLFNCRIKTDFFISWLKEDLLPTTGNGSVLRRFTTASRCWKRRYHRIPASKSKKAPS